MSQNIIDEVTFLLHSFLLGIIITFVYDGFLILRRLIRHSLFLISLEDMVFWIACAIGVFYMLYEENNGILRWFAVFGAALGMIAYKKSVSPLIIHFVTLIVKRIFWVFAGFFRFLSRPFRFVGKKVYGVWKRFFSKGRKVGKCAKNKLTYRLKLLKITLCKR